MSMAEHQGEGSDFVEFQLPLLGLYGDLEIGRGSVSLPDDFGQCPAMIQLGLLRDWHKGLLAYRAAALSLLAREVAQNQPGLSAAEMRNRVRAACEALGIEPPSETESLTTCG